MKTYLVFEVSYAPWRYKIISYIRVRLVVVLKWRPLSDNVIVAPLVDVFFLNFTISNGVFVYFMCNGDIDYMKYFQVPSVLTALQKSVYAMLLGRTQLPEWLTDGIKEHSKTATIRLDMPTSSLLSCM